MFAVVGNTNTIVQSFAVTENFTVARVRGMMSIALSAYSADISLVGAMGMAIVSDQAFAAGAASIPGPWTDIGWDGWFVWVPFAWEFAFTTDIDRLIGSVQVDIDSKAMRKIKIGDTLVVMAESSSAAFKIGMSFRILQKLV